MSSVSSRTAPAVARVGRCVQQRSRGSVLARCEPVADAPTGPVGIEQQGQNFEAVKDIDAIMKALPHRRAPVLHPCCLSELFKFSLCAA